MKPLFCLLLALSASSVCLADTAALQNCRLVKDAAARLACYDAIALPAPVRSPAAQVGAPAVAVVPPPATAAGSTVPLAPAVPVVPAAAVAATKPAAATDPAAIFGFENRPAPASTAVDALVSSIPGRFEGWLANGRIRLANGQVWQVSDGSQAAYDLSDPAVRITRGVAGTFFMEITGVAQTPRVRRVQ
jgi:hypothetical protein